MRMSTTTMRIVIGVVATCIIAIVTVVLSLSGKSKQDSTTTQRDALVPLTANFASLHSTGSITLFDRLTIPEPNVWDGTMSEPDTVMIFADHTVCTGSSADCAHIEFLNLASSGIEEHFGADPLKQWAAQTCAGGTSAQGIEGPAKLNLGGQLALFYRQQCGTNVVRYAWSVPGKQLLVLEDPGSASEITQAALERVQWK